jgi:hypothetical protein
MAFPDERTNGVQAQFAFGTPALFAFQNGWPTLLIQRVRSGRELVSRVSLGELFERRLYGGEFAAERPLERAPHTCRIKGLTGDRRPHPLARLHGWHGSAEYGHAQVTAHGARA